MFNNTKKKVLDKTKEGCTPTCVSTNSNESKVASYKTEKNIPLSEKTEIECDSCDTQVGSKNTEYEDRDEKTSPLLKTEEQIITDISGFENTKYEDCDEKTSPLLKTEEQIITDISGLENVKELCDNSLFKKWVKLISMSKTIIFDIYNRKEYFTPVADIVLDNDKKRNTVIQFIPKISNKKFNKITEWL